MAQHTPLVEAFAKMSANHFGHLYAAKSAKQGGARSNKHYLEAQLWMDAAWVLQEQASEDEQTIMQQIWQRDMKGEEDEIK